MDGWAQSTNLCSDSLGVNFGVCMCSYGVHICMCSRGPYVCARVWRLSVFLSCSLPYFLRQGLPLNWELTDSDKMRARSRALPPLPRTGVVGESYHSWLYEVCTAGPDSGLYNDLASTLEMEPSAQPNSTKSENKTLKVLGE